MSVVVFDLETSDLLPCGQILSYCFKQLSDDLQKELSALRGVVRLSPTQIPSFDAILATKIDVQDHLDPAMDSEVMALHKIHAYLSKIVSGESVTYLIAYNLAKFDLHFLRTSLIREGQNPYFTGGALKYVDALHLAQKMHLSRDQAVVESFKLQDLAVKWNVGAVKAHDASSDVDTLIGILRLFRQHGIQHEQATYEGRVVDRIGNGVYCNRYKFENGVHNQECVPLMLIDRNRSYDLWLDLSSDYPNTGRNAVEWYNSNIGFFQIVDYIDPSSLRDVRDWVESHDAPWYHTNTYFNKPICDIECHIYLLPFLEITILHDALHFGHTNKLQGASTYCNQLFIRAKLRDNDTHTELLSQYMHKRYNSNSYVISKNEPAQFHWTLHSQLTKVQEHLKRDRPTFLVNLESFYLDVIRTFDISSENC